MGKDVHTIHKKDLVCIGAFAGAHGVRGGVRVKSFTQDPQDFFTFETLYTQEGETAYHFSNPTPKGQGIYLARVKEVTTREAAESLKSTKLYAHRDDFPDLDEDEFYVKDLVGLQVRLDAGDMLGQIKSVQNYGAGDVLEIALKDSSQGLALPFSDEAVPSIHLKEGYVVVNKESVDQFMLSDNDSPTEENEEEKGGTHGTA